MVYRPSSNWWSSGYDNNPSGPYAISTPNFGIHGNYLPSSNKYPAVAAPKPEVRPFMATIDPYRDNENHQMRPLGPYHNYGGYQPPYYLPPTGRSSKGDGGRYSYETSYGSGQGRSMGNNRHGRIFNTKYSERRLDYLPPNDVDHDAGNFFPNNKNFNYTC